jgi:hypothetical protein
MFYSHELSLDPFNNSIDEDKYDRGLSDTEDDITVDWRKEVEPRASTKNHTSRSAREDADLLSTFQHLSILARTRKRKLEVMDGEDHIQEGMMNSEVRRYSSISNELTETLVEKG